MCIRTCSLRLETSSTAPVCGCPGNRIPAAPSCAVGKPMKGTAAKNTKGKIVGSTLHLNYQKHTKLLWASFVMSDYICEGTRANNRVLLISM